MRVLGIITARGGSKGIPRKNLYPILGKPLLQYTTEVALASKLDRVVLSTDDDEIAAIGLKLGVDVPFMRPPELAMDETPTVPVLIDVVKKLEAQGDFYDAIFTLQPTDPLRIVSDIDGSISLMISSNADSVISYSEIGSFHPARICQIDSNDNVFEFDYSKHFTGIRRQEFPKLYLRDGSVYLTRKDILLNEQSIKGLNCKAWIIPSERAWGIDESRDLVIVEALLLNYYSKTNG